MISASSSACPRRLLANSWKISARSSPETPLHSLKARRPLSVALSRSSREEVSISSMLSSVAGLMTFREPLSVMSLSVLLPHKEAAPAEDQDHGHDEDHRRERVDDGTGAELDHGVYLQRQRARSHACDEERYDEVVERERKRQESASHNAGKDQ